MTQRHKTKTQINNFCRDGGYSPLFLPLPVPVNVNRLHFVHTKTPTFTSDQIKFNASPPTSPTSPHTSSLSKLNLIY